MRLDLVNIFPVKLDLKPFIHLESGSFQFTFERNAWQKQEVLKGVDPYLARLDGGWGFHQFQDSTASGMSTVWRPYTPAEANAMIDDTQDKLRLCPIRDCAVQRLIGYPVQTAGEESACHYGRVQFFHRCPPWIFPVISLYNGNTWKYAMSFMSE